MTSRKSVGRAVLYGLGLAPAVLMLVYYAIEYIPAQHEYFVNLRFRSLAVIGSRLQTKVQRLAATLNAAATLHYPAAYIAAVVPDVHIAVTPCAAAQPAVQFTEDGVRFRSGTNCFAASIAQILGESAKDELFEHVLIADSQGKVAYQSGKTSPRIADLSKMLAAPADSKAGPREGNGTDSDTIRLIRLDDSDFMLLVQPVRIQVDASAQVLLLCGLVRSDVLKQEERHVPPRYLLLIVIPLLVILLGGPYLKVLLLTRTGRLAFRDLVSLCLCTLLAASIVTFSLAACHQEGQSGRESKENLRALATWLNDQLLTEIKGFHTVLLSYDGTFSVASGGTAPPDAASLPIATAGGRIVPFDFVFWTNAGGCQVTKWTTRQFITPRVEQTTQEHFRNILAKRLWTFQAQPQFEFTIQTLMSPTTSQLIAVMAIPSLRAGAAVRGCGQAASPVVSISLVAPIRSLTSPLMPPGAGFAVFEPDGRVLFHSSPARNLHENLFQEIRSPEDLRDAVALGQTRAEEAYYRGRKMMFYVQPVTGIIGIPWSIAVFQELEPHQALVGHVVAGTIVLFTLLLGAICVWILLLAVAARVRLRIPLHRIPEFFLSRIWPDEGRRPLFRRLAIELSLVTAVSLAVLVWGWATIHESSGWLLPFCFVAPLFAVVLASVRLWDAPPASADAPLEGRKQPAYVACVTLCMAMIAVLPTLGLFCIVGASESRTHLRQRQQELLKAVNARQTRLVADVESSRALSEQNKALLRASLARDTEIEKASGRGPDIFHLWQTSVYVARHQDIGKNPDEVDQERRQRLRSLLGWVGRDSEEATACCRWSVSGGTRVTMSSESGGGRDMVVSSALPSLPVPTNPAWWAAVAALVACGYAWNCLAFRRLYLLGCRCLPLPPLADPPLKVEASGHLLVLGLPLARKDSMVRDWLGCVPPRVNLYNAHFSPSWLEETVRRLEGELAAQPGRTTWVHISNLESKLVEPADRQMVADLVERLIVNPVGGVRVRLIVTSAVDPMFHFDSVLSSERRKIYEHPLPEPELQRLARLLHNFRKVQVPRPGGTPPEWAANKSGALIYEECRHHAALLALGQEVASAAGPALRRETLFAMIQERATALYKLFWASLTRPEKLLLIQLAQTGFVNPLCVDTLEELTRKGLILPGFRPRIMNETFRGFLEKVETRDTVRGWESEAGESPWPLIRNAVLAMVAIAVAVVALTQQQAMQTVTLVLTGVGTVLACLTQVSGFFTARRNGQAPPAPPQ